MDGSLMPANEHELIKLTIDGLIAQPLAIIDTPGGPVLHMLRPDFPLMPGFNNAFGEVYFSQADPGHIKGWKKHKKQTQLFSVPWGLLRIVLIDGRPDSPTYNTSCNLILGRPDHYNLLKIPPGIWYAFAAATESPALICNCADIPHSPEEAEKLPLDAPEFGELLEIFDKQGK